MISRNTRKQSAPNKDKENYNTKELNKKLSTFDLREIFYKANELEYEPVIMEKEVRDMLNKMNLSNE